MLFLRAWLLFSIYWRDYLSASAEDPKTTTTAKPTTLSEPSCGVASEPPNAAKYEEKLSEPGNIPWQAYIKFKKDNRWCGGTVIDEKYVLTNARCTKSLNFKMGTEDEFYAEDIAEVWAGIIDKKDPKESVGQKRKVAKIFEHEKYKPLESWNSKSKDFLAYDICILELTEVFNFSSTTNQVGKVCLEEKGEKPSDTYYFASGWSSTDDKQKDKLKYTRVPYVPNKECDYYKNFTYPGTEVVFGQLDVDSHFLCAGSVRDNGKNKGICFDDNNAGAPVTQEKEHDDDGKVYQLVGTSAYVPFKVDGKQRKCEVNKPQLITDFTKGDIIAWINKVINGKGKSKVKPSDTNDSTTKPGETPMTGIPGTPGTTGEPGTTESSGYRTVVNHIIVVFALIFGAFRALGSN